MKIVASFSSTMVETTFLDFEKAAYNFNISISEHIRRNISKAGLLVLEKCEGLEPQRVANAISAGLRKK